ncbi:hypothetical protein SESBI_35801 [Sesbania bispinosa]|nr:hypothetical protein SESBI_35801 [Sesbania bispinosa]
MRFSIYIYHEDKFVSDPKLHYRGGESQGFDGLDINTWSYFEALGYVRDLGYRGNVKLWWKKARSTLDKGLKALLTDDDVGEVASYAEGKKVKVQICVEHIERVNENDQRGNVVGDQVEIVSHEQENNSNDDNNDLVRDVHFDDSEEERNLVLDEGFDIHEPGEAEAVLKEKLESMKMKFVTALGGSSSPLEEQNA